MTLGPVVDLDDAAGPGVEFALAGDFDPPPGWTEISAVCTDPAVRGQGLATRPIRSVAARIVARGDRVFLHTSAENTDAIRLYLDLGFRLRRTTTFRLLVTPEPPVEAVHASGIGRP
jgi:ribosomal protein S18 acetylase RimI-like enzyme